MRKKVGDIRQTLPEGVIGPFFNDEFGDTYITLYALTGDGFTYPELKDFAKRARDMLLRVPGVAKVDLLGTQDEKIYIDISSATLAERGLSALDIQAALAGQNTLEPAGRVESERALGAPRRERRARARSRTSASCGCAPANRPSASATSPRSRRASRTRRPAKIRYHGKEAVLLGTVMAQRRQRDGGRRRASRKR